MKKNEKFIDQIEKLIKDSEEERERAVGLREIFISRIRIFLYQDRYFDKRGIEKIEVEDNEYLIPGFGKVVPKFTRAFGYEKQTVMHVYLHFPKLPSKEIYEPVVLPCDPDEIERPGDLFMMIALDKSYLRFKGLKIFRYDETYDGDLELKTVWCDCLLDY